MAYNREDLLKELQRRGVDPANISQPQQQTSSSSGGYNRQALEAEMSRRNYENEQSQEQPLDRSNDFIDHMSNLAGGVFPGGASVARQGMRLAQSAAQGGMEAGRSISNLPHAFGAEGWSTPQGPNFGPKNPTLLEEATRVLAPGVALGAATGGIGSAMKVPGWLNAPISGAITGGALDEDHPIRGAATGAIAGLATKAIPRLIDMARNSRPQKVTDEFIKKYGKEAAIKLKEFTKETWNPINESGNENIYNKINPARRETTPAYAKYVEKLRNEPKFESFNDIFAENPNLENTHKLQSEIGKELRHLDKSDKMGNDINWLRYKELSKIRQDLKTDINSYMETLSPELREAHKVASKTHKDIIVPTRNAVRTAGKITSPIDEKVDPRELMSLLKSATKDEKLSYRPLPEEAITLTKQLKRNLGNNRKLLLGAVPAITATGVGYHKAHLLRHLLGY